MKRRTRRTSESAAPTSTQDKLAAYDAAFAERIIAALEAGTAPWIRPWAPGTQTGPRNFTTGREYRGGNHLWLQMAGFDDPRWGGFGQIRDAGGRVRKGSKGSIILYMDRFRRVRKVDAAGRPEVDADGRPVYLTMTRERPLIRVHHVFNVAQCDGLNLPSLDKAADPDWDSTRADAVIANAGVPIAHRNGDRAYYSPSEDRIVLPARGQFVDQPAYLHTALHELGHATGHESRLNRPTLTKHDGFGSETYAREELRAEIGAMMTGERLGVGHSPQHGESYIASWIKALKSDPREIRRAASDAAQIADWLCARESGRAATAA